MNLTLVQPASVEVRARRSGGMSNEAILRMTARAICERHAGGGTLLDVGCGRGDLWGHLRDRFAGYVGVDVIRHEGFSAEGDAFVQADLDAESIPLAGSQFEVVAAVETIEHLENPRAFFRELTRLARPGGWIVVTTPNQLSFLSKLTLLFKDHFNAFQAGDYPAHITALLEVDLRRMAWECGLVHVATAFSCRGRIVLTPWHYPAALARVFPRPFSDNILLIAEKPA